MKFTTYFFYLLSKYNKFLQMLDCDVKDCARLDIQLIFQ